MSTADSALPHPDDRGLYLLVMQLRKPVQLKAGTLPDTPLDPGTYLYVGRAKKNLKARVARHLRSQKKLFWHIDYLLQHAYVDSVGFRWGIFDECRTARTLLKQLPTCSNPIHKFGASDCRCPGHLLYLPAREQLRAHLSSRFTFEEVDP